MSIIPKSPNKLPYTAQMPYYISVRYLCCSLLRYAADECFLNSILFRRFSCIHPILITLFLFPHPAYGRSFNLIADRF